MNLQDSEWPRRDPMVDVESEPHAAGPCSLCNGTGVCGACRRDSFAMPRCGACHGTGKCMNCRGTGSY